MGEVPAVDRGFKKKGMLKPEDNMARGNAAVLLTKHISRTHAFNWDGFARPFHGNCALRRREHR